MPPAMNMEHDVIHVSYSKPDDNGRHVDETVDVNENVEQSIKSILHHKGPGNSTN